MVVKGKFKGHPTLGLKRSETDEKPFSFGLTKAKLIMENIKEIEKFVQENELQTAMKEE